MIGMTKTALGLTPQERQMYHPAEAIERRRGKEKLRLNKRKQQAWQLVYQAAQLLQREFKAKRIVVCGSLVHGAWFYEWSDTDLAV